MTAVCNACQEQLRAFYGSFSYQCWTPRLLGYDKLSSHLHTGFQVSAKPHDLSRAPCSSKQEAACIAIGDVIPVMRATCTPLQFRFQESLIASDSRIQASDLLVGGTVIAADFYKYYRRTIATESSIHISCV